VFKYPNGKAERWSGWWQDPSSLWQLDFRDAYTSVGTGTQETTSEGHPWRSISPTSGDVGGNFTTVKKYQEVEGPMSFDLTGTFPLRNSGVRKETYKGPLLPADPSLIVYPTQVDSSDAFLSAKGATAIARCSPTNPVANLSTALGELVKDRLPAVPGMRTWEAKIRTLANAGDEFLNVAFGWAPLISDIKATAKAVAHAQTVLKQFERDAGKVVRRRYAFDTTTDTSTTLVGSGGGPAHGRLPSGDSRNLSEILGVGNVYRTRKTVRSIWFSGAFTYYLPSGYDSRRKLDEISLEAKKVFGLTLTPEVLYNLTPWSWALDWVTNVGDVIKNVTQHTQYGQILRYGYIMETTSVIDTYSWQRTAFGTNCNQNYTVPLLRAVTTVKKRRGASPFGFGVTWSGLTPLQQAIAAALGLTHSRN